MGILSEKELQAAVQILERHIDLEQQCVKCLESINYSVSGKAVEITQELVAGQSRLARLRSRVLRCITQQLQQRYKSVGHLPVWSSPLSSNPACDIEGTGEQSNLESHVEQMENSAIDEQEQTVLKSAESPM